MSAPDLNPYLLLSTSDLRGEYAGPATLENVYLSSIALVAHLVVDLPDAGSAPRGDHETLRIQLRLLMRSLLTLLRGHGMDCPAVALLSPGQTSAMKSKGASDIFLAAYSSLQSDQDWHRGEFLVFVAESDEKAAERLQDLLAPQPPTVELPVVAQLLPEVIEKSRAESGKNAFFEALIGVWEDEIAKCQTEGVTSGERDTRCAARTRSAIDERERTVLNRASEVLARLG